MLSIHEKWSALSQPTYRGSHQGNHNWTINPFSFKHKKWIASLHRNMVWSWTSDFTLSLLNFKYLNTFTEVNFGIEYYYQSTISSQYFYFHSSKGLGYFFLRSQLLQKYNKIHSLVDCGRSSQQHYWTNKKTRTQALLNPLKPSTHTLYTHT